MKSEVINEALKATPPVTVSVAATAAGWSMADWMALATILYVVMQAAYLGWKWYHEFKSKR